MDEIIFMNKAFLFTFFASCLFSAQNVVQRLGDQVQTFLNSKAMSAAHLSFYVSDDKGNLVYEYQGSKGLSTASTQKIFTAITALETLGEDYRFTTSAAYSGKIEDGVLKGDLYLASNGDPSLGSWRYEGYKPEDFKRKFIEAVHKLKLKVIKGRVLVDDSYFDFQSVPGGWPWNDIGNYYGAGVYGVNWNENQFDVRFSKSGEIKNIKYNPPYVQWVNDVSVKGSSDQSIIYTAPFSEVAYINGSIPEGKESVVSGAMPNPPLFLAKEVEKWLEEDGVEVSGEATSFSLEKISTGEKLKVQKSNIFFNYNSPSLDKIIYWFLRKSVNLYGEALVKTFSKLGRKDSSHEEGVQFLKNFWLKKGIASEMIHFKDGSGLSPQNYVSAKAEVQALLYAQDKRYFSSFYEALPLYNGMKMKSGTISGCKAYAGYHTAKNGKKYVYSIMVNNYSGGNINAELYKILDILK